MFLLLGHDETCRLFRRFGRSGVRFPDRLNSIPVDSGSSLMCCFFGVVFQALSRVDEPRYARRCNSATTMMVLFF